MCWWIYDILHGLLIHVYVYTCICLDSLHALLREKYSQQAYGGGVVSPIDDRIYQPPTNGTQAIRFDPVTKTFEEFGDTFRETRCLSSDKWYELTLSSIDNCMYAPPMLGIANRVLKIDPKNDTAREVGEDLRSLAGGAENWAWLNFCEGADGCLYAAPCNATSVLRFDPRTNEATTFSQLRDPVVLNYTKSVSVSGRYILGIPGNASRVLCIDTQDLTTELIGDDFGSYIAVEGGVSGVSMGEFYTSHNKWHFSALGGDKCIYALPLDGTIPRVLRIDPVAKTTSLFGPHLYELEVPYTGAWYGMCTGMDGCLYATPLLDLYRRILKIDPFAGTVSTLGTVPPDFRQKLGFGVVDRDGAIMMLIVNTPGRHIRIAPGRPRISLLTSLLQPQHRALLHDGLRDYLCYGPALVVELWREGVRAAGQSAIVCKLLDAAATSLPAVVTTSLKEDNGSTARMLIRTIVAILPLQVGAIGA